jgi:cell division protein FtsI (penicillin-binding protein 3)
MKPSCLVERCGSRLPWVLGGFALVLTALASRALYLHVFNKDFLQQRGEARHVRERTLAVHRGMITDRHGEPLAISTPVDSVWANPQELIPARDDLPKVARLLGIESGRLTRLLASHQGREFVYLRRHVSPELAAQVKALAVPGVYLQREYRRYYPAGEVTAHVLGFTNVDDAGQEGLELAYDDWLRGEAGLKRVIKDNANRIVEDIEILREPRPGRDLMLSLDRRLQYVVHRELKAAVAEHRARAGSAVILDIWTGEVLAMANQPSYNPNTRTGLSPEQRRNRAVTDVFEPGSTIKPFTVAAGLDSGQWRADTLIDTAPGRYRVGRKTISDVHNYGLIDVSTVITKSSNIGATKIALSLPPKSLWRLFTDLGFGARSGSGFPGEVSGFLGDWQGWDEVERATLSFGYGVSVTPLQLAQAYAVLASDGRRRPLSFMRATGPVEGEAVLPAPVAARVRSMLETVVSPEGTANLARVAGYRVGGKTGTVRSAVAGGYSTERYLSVFAGVAPMSAPRFAMVVMVTEPSAGQYYGGLVAAPVFGKAMDDVLRLLDVPPDNLPTPARQIAQGHASQAVTP